MKLPVGELCKINRRLKPQGLYCCSECGATRPLADFYVYANERVQQPCRRCHRARIAMHREQIYADAQAHEQWKAKQRQRYRRYVDQMPPETRRAYLARAVERSRLSDTRRKLRKLAGLKVVRVEHARQASRPIPEQETHRERA